MKDLLTLTQWLSPSFPLGAFAYSHGLEQVIVDGAVTDADNLTVWLADILRHGAGFTDAVLLCRALAGEDQTETAVALAGSAERLEETTAQGRAFADTVAALGVSVTPAPLPVAVGHAARSLDLAPKTVAALYLHGFASNLVSCAVRFVPLGQSEGQGALTALHPVIEEVAARAATASLDDIGQSVILADMAAMRHEVLQPRIFRT